MSGPSLASGRLQDRIVVFFVGLLMAIQAVSFFSMRYLIDRTARDTLREELRTGGRVFQRLQQQTSQRLVESAVVLTSDFAFRGAIASNDRETILSVLRNHAGRVNATGVSLVNLQGVVVADTRMPAAEGKPYPSPHLVRLADSVGRASGIRLIEGRPYQSVIVPVLAPRPIAWVSMDFVVDDATARDLKNLSLAEVSFVRVPPQGETEVLVTTLPKIRRQGLWLHGQEIVKAGAEGTRVDMVGEAYESLAVGLDESGSDGLHTFLQRPVSDGLAPYLGLEAAMLIIAGLSLALTLAGAVRIARRVTQPVERLAEAAREIEQGNYNVRVGNNSADEVGALARAFDGMAKGLAERDRMKDVLGKVASSDVVSRLMDTTIKLGGSEVEATVMFTDMRGFTTIAESLTPQQSLVLLNRLLTVVAEVIEEHDGVLDKFLGDGAMVVFGAPIRRDDDVQRAVRAALAIRARVAALGPELATSNLPKVQVGVGLNTARVIAGNIGSPSRMNYTVLGDGVNLAARLEGLTKRYHVPIIVGETTREKSTGFVWRELDKVRVRGKSVAVRIFEPLGREGQLQPADLVRLAQWNEALEAFRSRRWAEARGLFEKLAEDTQYARLVVIYLGYLRELAEEPPGEDWDAAFTLYDK